MTLPRLKRRDEELPTEVDHVPTMPRPTQVSFVLRVLAGPDQGTEYPLDLSFAGPCVVGTSQTCALRLTDSRVSRRHLSLEHCGASVRLRDLDSANGTFVGGLRVFEVELVGGEYIRVGATTLCIENHSGAASVEVPIAQGFGKMLGASLEMRKLYPLCAKLAASSIPVVIGGETGTGKEVLAESLHEMGPRASGPFVVFDCTAVTPSLVESALFGHERGAFTGAVRDHAGVFEQAHGGTLLVDEIGDLDLALQAKLLRVIERAELRRVGGKESFRVDVRVLAATRRDLDREVEHGRFRDDLFHRLSVASIELPPLRRRRGDVPLLARHFWEQLGATTAQLSPALLDRWDIAPWPGNVRELRNAVLRQHALGEVPVESDGSDADVPSSTRPEFDLFAELIRQGLTFPQARDRMLEAFERRYLSHVLDQHHGNIGKAAEAAGVGRRYFQRLKARTRRP